MSLSITGIVASPVITNIDVAPDIGRAADHDYSCSSNADTRWGATTGSSENRTKTGWQWNDKKVAIVIDREGPKARTQRSK